MRKGCSAWWKNHGHLSSIKCSPIGQGNFTNFHELGKPVLPLFPTRATIPPPPSGSLLSTGVHLCQPPVCHRTDQRPGTMRALRAIDMCTRRKRANERSIKAKSLRFEMQAATFMACKKFLVQSLFKLWEREREREAVPLFVSIVVET